VEIFATLQGEGGQAGCPAVFVRFAGCNLWSGLDEHRERDATRHGARCPMFCDTDFRGGESLDREALVRAVQQAAQDAGMGSIGLVVFTGGEPLLQLELELIDALKSEGARCAIETNGTSAGKPGVLEALDWITVSPKLPDSEIVVRRGSELKVVYPAHEPLAYEELARGFQHLFVQPEARTSSVGQSQLDPDATEAAVRFCIENPGWRLSLQSHKLLGLP
jgi:organic radical activating enzyme